jgi:hypothetical protein
VQSTYGESWKIFEIIARNIAFTTGSATGERMELPRDHSQHRCSAPNQ